MLDIVARHEDYRAIRERLFKPPSIRRAGRWPMVDVAVVNAAAQREREAGVIEAIDKAQQPLATFHKITAAVCRYFALPKIQVFSRRNIPSLVRPRMVIVYLADKHTGMTLGEIGKLLSGRDHTTILHSKQKMHRLLAEGDQELAADIAAIERNLGLA